MKTLRRLGAVILLGLGFAFAANGEVLDTAYIWGNGGDNGPNPIGKTPGTFVRPGDENATVGNWIRGDAANSYSITAAGTDIWSATDHGIGLFEDGVTRDGNFSAIVRSVAVAADPAEINSNQWGRSGVMARKDPSVANSANVAHIRKSGTSHHTVLQGRAGDGQGTERTDTGRGGNGAGEFGNNAENNANGSTRNTPIWLGLHRYDDVYYATWAPDNDGTPGEWSNIRYRENSTADLLGPVHIGLCHQAHGNDDAHNSGGNTADFDNFQVTDFNPDLGVFPSVVDGSLTLDGDQVRVTATGSEIGSAGDSTEWEVQFIGEPDLNPGGVKVDIYLQGNAGNLAAFQTMIAGDPAGTTIIETIRWASANYTETNAAGVNLFAEAVPGSFGGGQDNYGTHITGEIFIPSDASRDNIENVLFHDGTDDFCWLVVDGVELINDNAWSNLAGTGNNGGAQAEFDCSAAKFDDGEWVSFEMGTWEGGGGDDGYLVWDALDRTGADDVTGAVDAFTNSYAGEPLGLGTQVSFNHDRSDEIPAANFRTIQETILTTEGDTGQPTNLLLDNAVTPDVVELRLYVNGQLVDSVLLDRDGDGLPDDYEIANDLDPNNPADAAQGANDGLFDNDGLTNLEEFMAGTDPNNADTDGDGLADGVEDGGGIWVSASQTGTDPLNDDTDGDSLLDGVETNGGVGSFVDENDTGTDPNKIDTDGDAVDDSREINSGTDPTDPNSKPAFPVPIGFWPFDDQADVTEDLSPNENHATLMGGTTYVAGHTGAPSDFAIEFNGVDAAATTTAMLLSNIGEFTMSGWVRMPTAQPGNRVGWFGQNDAIEFGMINPTTMQHWTPAGGGALNVAFGPTAEQWTHIAVVGDTQERRTYIDGVLSGTNANPTPTYNTNTSFAFNMGGAGIYDGTGNWYLGELDDVAVWDTVLSESQIIALASGAIDPMPLSREGPRITEILYDADNGEFTLTWTAREGATYGLFFSTDLLNFDADIDDSIVAEGDMVTYTFDHPDPGAEEIFFRAEQF